MSNTVSTSFKVGDRVRVKRGIIDIEYPDLPLGGWAGKVIELSGEMCVVEWSEATLAAIHPVYKNRCERDGSHCEIYHLPSDELERDTGGPLDIEQPTQIVSRPLSPTDQEDRIRVVFGLTSDDLLPDVCNETLHAYHQYLLQHLVVPFPAQHGVKHRQAEKVDVIGLIPPDEEPVLDAEYGLVCAIRSEQQAVTLPVGELDDVEGNPARQLVGDYCHWFHNWC